MERNSNVFILVICFQTSLDGKEFKCFYFGDFFPDPLLMEKNSNVFISLSVIICFLI